MLTCKIHKKHQVEKRDHVKTCNDNFIYKNMLIMKGEMEAGEWTFWVMKIFLNVLLAPGLRVWRSEDLQVAGLSAIKIDHDTKMVCIRVSGAKNEQEANKNVKLFWSRNIRL